MNQPEGYHNGSSQVCKLKRCIYGLKQASRCWNQTFADYLHSIGFDISTADPCLFIRHNGEKKLVCLYVDDGLVATNDLTESDKFLNELRSKFKITTKPAEYFLGLEIGYLDDGSIKIGQSAYAKKILKRFNMENCNSISTPIIKDKIVEQDTSNVESLFPYREAVGALMYLMLGSTPDLSYTVSVLSRHLENPNREDWLKVKRALRYIAGTINKCILYKFDCEPGILSCYSDSDYAGCNDTGRSTSGAVFIYSGGAISWFSQRQSVTALSTTEAELIACSECAKEAIWLKRLFQEITSLNDVPIIFVDNIAAIRLTNNPEFHRRTKHISVRYFFIREKVLESQLKVMKVSTEMQAADLMTKPLPKSRLICMSALIGLN